MYVLYYFEQDYDYAEKQILGVSASKEKLEQKKQEILNGWEESRKVYDKWEKRSVKAHTQYRERVKKFLLENLDAIKCPYRTDGQWVKEKSTHSDYDGFYGRCRIRASGCGDFHEPEPPPPEIVPFSKEEEEYVKGQQIESLSWQYTATIKNRLFLDKLKGELPEMTEKEIEAMDAQKAPPYQSRSAENLIIEETQEF